MVKMVTDYRYHIYADRNNGRGMELAAWYDTYKQARKEANFLASKGFKVEIRENF